MLHLLAVGCLLSVCGVVYAAVYQPLGEWRRGIAGHAELLKEKLALAPQIRRQHAEKSDELEELLASVRAIGQRIPNRPREGEFLGELGRIAEAHGVQIKDFKRGKVDETTTHSAVPVEITGEASYRGLCGLLDSVAGLPRLASLERMKITPSSTQGNYEIRLGYLLYYGIHTDSAGQQSRG